MPKNKLKTLKDISCIACNHDDCKGDDYCESYTRHDLKQEAIKWYNLFDSSQVELSNGLASTDTKSEIYNLNKRESKILQFFIEHFFNINEDEINERDED